MREILFRGKRVDNGEWIYGYYFKATQHWHNHGIHEDWIAMDTVQNGGWCNVRGKYAVLPETTGQYTGLTDKNGKKIFEGDIVNFSDILYYIVFADGCFRIGRNGQYSYTLHNLHSAFEIVGNTHDNHELLEIENDKL